MGQKERLARLMECWSVLLLEWEQAIRWRDKTRLRGLATALKLVDACLYAEEGLDEQGVQDQLLMSRLREIATIRDILKGVDWSDENAAAVDPEAETTT